MEGKLEFDEIWNDIKWLMDGMMVMVKDLARSKRLNPDEFLELNKSSSSQIFQSHSSIPVACESTIFPPLEAGVRVADGSGQPFKLESLEAAYKILDEMTNPAMTSSVEDKSLVDLKSNEPSPLKLEGPKIVRNLFDKMPSLPSKKKNEGKDNTKDDVLPAVCFSQVMGSEVGIKEYESTNSSLKTKLEEVFDTELTQDLSPKLNHLRVDEEFLATVKNGDQHFGSAADFTTNMETFYQIILENDTFQLFDEMPISATDKNMPYLASTKTVDLIKCKCKNRAPLIYNDVAFYFDPGGCTLSEMNFKSSEIYGDQGGLCLAFGLAPNVTDALVNAISHEPWISEAYGYRDVIDYFGTKKEFVGEGSAQNALTAGLRLIEIVKDERSIM